jgi:hypothetical protein
LAGDVQTGVEGLPNDVGPEGPGAQRVVVLPSMTISLPPEMVAFAAPILRTHEERLLCFLPMLRQPSTHLVYLSSVEVPPVAVDYWLSLVPGLNVAEARERLTMLSLDDASPRPLADKVLDRADVLAGVRELVAGPSPAYLLPSHANESDFEVAARIGIPVYGMAPRLISRFASKSGARAVFAACDVPHPAGVAGVRTVDDVVAAIRSLRSAGRAATDMVLKRDQGGGGHLNAILRTGDASDGQLRDRVLRLEPDDAKLGVEFFLALLERGGGVVEELLTGADLRSPSALLRITPQGRVELLATHDQVLGGRTNQSYIGCRFPAHHGYAPTIARLAVRIGRHLADAGVVGHVGVDFVCRRDGDGWEAFAIEINPRMTGTVHHAYTLRMLTRGKYDPEAGLFLTRHGSPRYYVGSDQVPARSGADPVELIAQFQNSEVGWNAGDEAGVVLHTLSALAVTGSVGVTAVGSTVAAAASLHDRATRMLKAT